MRRKGDKLADICLMTIDMEGMVHWGWYVFGHGVAGLVYTADETPYEDGG